MGIFVILILLLLLLVFSSLDIPFFHKISLWESSQKKRQRLLQEMSGRILFPSFPERSQKKLLRDLPQYKFYTPLYLKLVHYSRLYGLALGGVLRSLKEGLIRDDRFERKASKDFWGILMQFALISLVTWIF